MLRLLGRLYHRHIGLLGRLAGHTHAVVPVKKDLVAREKFVNLLQRQPLGLGIEEVNERNEEEVENAEVDVGPPADVVDGDGRDLDDEEGEDPVGGGGQGGSSCTDSEGRIFGGH